MSPWYPLNRRLGGPRSRSGRGVERTVAKRQGKAKNLKRLEFKKIGIFKTNK
jgi:hypothetical protein